MITYQPESIMNIWGEVQPLIHANHEEIDLFGEPLEVDAQALMELDANRMLKIFTMRKDGELVGYCQFIVYHHMHHVRMMIANQDVIFIKKSHRGHAIKFVQYCDSELKKLGVQVVLQHSPAMKEWGTVLERLGYKKLETTYQRRL